MANLVERPASLPALPSMLSGCRSSRFAAVESDFRRVKIHAATLSPMSEFGDSFESYDASR